MVHVLHENRAPVRLAAVLVAAAPGPDPLVLVAEDAGRHWLPSADVAAAETCAAAAAQLLLELTGVAARVGPGTSGWVDLVLAGLGDHPGDAADGTRVVYVLYGTLLPADVKPTAGAAWVAVSKLFAAEPELAAVAADVIRKV
jgi:hypothetical protein